MNLPKSLSEKHQLFLADAITNLKGGVKDNFIYKGDVVKEGKCIKVSDLDPHIVSEIPVQMDDDITVYRTEHVEVECVKYVSGEAFLLAESEFCSPEFSILHEILCMENCKLLVLEVLSTDGYLEGKNAYQVSHFIPKKMRVLELTLLEKKWPLPVYVDGQGKMVISNRCSVLVPGY